MSQFFRVSDKLHHSILLLTLLAAAKKRGSTVSLATASKFGQVSLGYLEELVVPLKRAGFIAASRGRNGGYQIIVNPKKITMEKIVQAVEGPVELVECQRAGNRCPATTACSFRWIWNDLQKQITIKLRNTTLDQLLYEST